MRGLDGRLLETIFRNNVESSFIKKLKKTFPGEFLETNPERGLLGSNKASFPNLAISVPVIFPTTPLINSY